MKTVGGGRAKPVADAFNSFLLTGLQDGSFGDSLGGILSGGNNPLTEAAPIDMNDPLFAAAQALFGQENNRNIADLRSRFGAAGGAPRGSAAMLAETLYRSDAANRQVLGMGEIANSIREQNRADRAITSQEMMFKDTQKFQALAGLLDSYNRAMTLGTPQAQTVQQPSTFGQIMGAVSGLAPFALAPFTGGASLGLSGFFGNSGKGGGYKLPPGKMASPPFNPSGGSSITYPGNNV